MASKFLTPSNIAAAVVVIVAYLLTRNTQLACILGITDLVALYGSRELLLRSHKKKVAAAVASAPVPATPGAAPPAVVAAADGSAAAVPVLASS